MYALVLVLFFASQAPASATEQPPFHGAPGLQAAYEQADAALRNDQPEEALRNFHRLLADAPEHPATHWLHGRLRLKRGHFAEAETALSQALARGIDPRHREEVEGQLDAVRRHLSAMEEARLGISSEHGVNAHDPESLFDAGIRSLEAGEVEGALAHARRLTALAPWNGEGHALLAVILETRGDDEAAREAVRRARELGATQGLLRVVEERFEDRRRGWLLVGIPLGMALFLGLGLLLSWLAGRALSSAQLGRLQASDLHLLREEQTASERLVDRLYIAVLWFSSLLFYVAVPMMVVLTLAVFGGLLLAMAMMPVIPVKLLFIVVIACLGGIIGIFRGLFFRDAQPDEGRALKREEAPRLFAALEEVADVAKSRKVDRVLIDAGTGIGVSERGGRLRGLLGRGERVLQLGLGVVRLLTVSELKSILAHEYGHFSHGETRLTPIIGRIQIQMVRMLHAIQAAGWASINPVWWFLRTYFFVHLRITAGHGRRRELLADRVSALAYGGDTFARALTKTVEGSDAFKRGMSVTVGLRATGRPTKDLFHTIDVVARDTPLEFQAFMHAQLFACPVDAYDTHPPPSERIERVAGLPGHRPVEDTSALTLFADGEALTAELGGELLSNLENTLEGQGHEAAPPVDVTDEERDRLAAALALHHAAVVLGEHQHPVAYPLLQESVGRLEQTAGEKHPYLVPLLTDLSRLHVEHQALDAARHALQRAIDIVQSRPDHVRQEVDALNVLLSEIPHDTRAESRTD
ncbi:M48 family metalloprotease [Myxococcus llanfairpwllgwyngyllgogerychwyrndrobwllllantysiliogogogochensis]|uniref:M48 family metalloprotease n=1 Tax=Myxococcus llanfairpwllgwyngyllgogerychwyrndrobwllllantysiliogogogochensis TaxID=2590453 RepID=A0A540WXL3_9BACT|nr:tetratricopeptide repeat protein [Myxococcus llanfairpwllgwyngyllgogerychwyrndrobwllllantysiliogogogochensis]TQF13670.1 M48 family metalloprotease [Myxococcus llanfairpwllgwyngyllgogerychwyrndrobwllllantysiliogogogochensis]